MRFGGETFGLLQLNDRRKGKFSPRFLGQLERVAENIAVALSRLLARDALRESEDRFRSLSENALVGMLIAHEGRIVSWNPEMERILGPLPEGAEFRRLGKIHPEDDRKFQRLCDMVRNRESFRRGMELRFIMPAARKGRYDQRWVHCLTVPIDFRGRQSTLVNVVDVTRIKELERILTYREKFASVGQVSAGIAHEIRNLLSGINLNISTLDLLCRRAEGMNPEDREKIRLVVEQARASTEKISSVISRIMELSRPVLPRMERIDIHHVVRDALAALKIGDRKIRVGVLEHPPRTLCMFTRTALSWNRFSTTSSRMPSRRWGP